MTSRFQERWRHSLEWQPSAGHDYRVAVAELRAGRRVARSSSQRRPSVSPQIDRSALKVASDPRKLLAPLPIPAATPAASSALQCAEKRRGGARLAMHDDGSAGCSSAGPVAPYSRVTCRRPDDSLAPPLMEGRSAPLPPRRRWERHWWWPGRPSAAARGARAAVSLRRHGFERGCLASSGAAGGRRLARSFLFKLDGLAGAMWRRAPPSRA